MPYGFAGCGFIGYVLNIDHALINAFARNNPGLTMIEKPLVRVGDEYVIARLYEAMVDCLLAVELFEMSITRSAAGKAFSAVRALMSALIVKYSDKLIETAKDDKERAWLARKAHVVPTHSMKSLALYLKRVGVDLGDVVDKALSLHAYRYNGFEPGFSPYDRIEPVVEDVNYVVTSIPRLIERYFPERYGELMDLAKRIRAVKVGEVK
ncbi:MAG: PaREP1 family protein [Vulcanisaeta sp.]